MPELRDIASMAGQPEKKQQHDDRSRPSFAGRLFCERVPAQQSLVRWDSLLRCGSPGVEHLGDVST